MYLAANKNGNFWIARGSEGPIRRGTYSKSDAYRFPTEQEAQEWIDAIFRRGEVQRDELIETEGLGLVNVPSPPSPRVGDIEWESGCSTQDEKDSDWFGLHQI